MERGDAVSAAPRRCCVQRCWIVSPHPPFPHSVVGKTNEGSLASLVILAAMVEISDRPFGGVSVETNISWTAEKFREALMDLAAREGVAKELLADRSREGEMVEERI